MDFVVEMDANPRSPPADNLRLAAASKVRGEAGFFKFLIQCARKECRTFCLGFPRIVFT